MNRMNNRLTRSLLISLMIALFLLTGCAVSHGEKSGVSKVVFYVG